MTDPTVVTTPITNGRGVPCDPSALRGDLLGVNRCLLVMIGETNVSIFGPCISQGHHQGSTRDDLFDIWL